MSGGLRRDVLFATAAGALVLALHLVYWDRGFVLLDEGYVATIADLLARGGALYRDAVTYVLPGSFALLAGVFELTSPSLLVARGLTLVLVVALVLASFRVGRAALAPSAAALAAAFVGLLTVWSYPQWHVYGYQQPGIVAVVVAAALLAADGAAHRRARVVLSGLLVGLAGCTKQTHVTAAIALGAFLVADVALGAPARGASTRRASRIAPLVLFAGAAALPVAATLALLALGGTIGDFWVQGVLSPLHGASYDGYVGLPALRPLLAQDADLRGKLVYYLPPLLLELRMPEIAASRVFRETPLVDLALKALFWAPFAVPVAAVVRLAATALGARRRPLDRAWPAVRGAALLLALDLALLAGTNRPLDWMHVSLAWIGTIPLGVWVVAGGGRAPRAALALLGAVLVALVVPTLVLLADLRARSSQAMALARAGVSARPPDARVMESLSTAIAAATRPGEPILVVPYQPLVYFLADRPPASRFLFTWPVEYQAGRDREMLAALDREGVGTVIHGAVGAPQLGTLGANAPELLDGLVERYRVAEVFGAEPWGIAFLRLERRPAPPAGTRRLEPGAGARVVTWPFDRVLAADLAPDRATSEIRVPIEAGAPGDLVIGYGMNPDRWVAPRAVPLSFEAAIERDGVETLLWRDVRNPQARVDERAWRQRRAPLDGRAATLVLRVAAPPGSPVDGDLAGWTLPSIEPVRPIAPASHEG